MRRSSSLLYSLIAIVLFAAPSARAETSCAIAGSSIQAASTLRGLRIKHPVPCLIHDRDEVRAYLISAVAKKMPAARLENEELVARALGLIPEDFDYREGLISLYLSQLGGYYDPEKQHYVMAGWLPDFMQTTIAVHELTHALQDQYFDLKQFIDETKMNSDQLLARSALVEGDATAVMLDYQRSLVNQGPLAKERNVDSFIAQSVLGMSMTAGAQNVPESLKLMLVFPYASGLRFVHAQLQKGGYAAVNRIFEHPVRSTEEILHPEMYDWDKPDFQEIDADALKDLAGCDSCEAVYTDRIGEFGIAALLGQDVATKSGAASGAAGWGGDLAAVLRDANTNVTSVAWLTRWDTPEDAREFYDLYQRFLSSKKMEQGVEPSAQKVTLTRSAPDRVFFLARRNG